MGKVLLPVLPMVLAVSVLMLGNSLFGLAITLKLNAAGTSSELIGLVLSAFFVGFMLGSLLTRRLMARVGHIRAFAVLGAFCATTALLHALTFDVYFWMLLRTLYGFCTAGLYTCIESWLNERTTNATRARVLTFYMTCYYLALACGQLLINLWSFDSAAVFVVAGLLVTLAVQPVLLTVLPQPEMRAAQPMPLKSLFRLSPLAVVGTLTSGLLAGGVQSLAAVYGQETGLSVLEISFFTGAMLFGPFFFLWPIGRLSDRLGRRTALGIVLTLLILSALGIFALQWVQHPFAALIVLTLLMGGAITSIYPNSVAHAYDQLPKEQYVAASGGLLLSYSIGAIVGPTLAATAMSRGGPDALFLEAALCGLLLLLFLLYRARARPQVPVVGSKEAFVSVAPTTQLSGELDPRRPQGEEPAR